MLKNYITNAWRSILKNSFYSFITIGGLALGIGLTLSIVSYVAYEYSFDRFNPTVNRIYKAELREGDKSRKFVTPMSYNFAEALANKSPEIQDFARIREKDPNSAEVEADGRKFFEPEFLFADGGLFRLFAFDFIEGDPASALAKPGSIVLTEEIARKYFGDEPATGKQIVYNKQHPLMVTGVIKNVPANSSIQFQLVADLTTARRIETTFFHSIMPADKASAEVNNIGATGAYHTWFQLAENADVKKLESRIPTILTSGVPTPQNQLAYYLAPLERIHFDILSPEALTNVRIFSLIAALILVLAIVNYINLTTARAFERAKELFMRKITGATRKMLVMQIYTESFLYVSIAFLVGVGLFVLARQLFPEFLQTVSLFAFNRFIILPFLVVYLLTILFTGSYPAVLMSRSHPLEGLRNRNSLATGRLRKGLTIFQFTVCTGLILAFTVIHQQFNMLLQKDTGLSKEKVVRITLPHTPALERHFSALRHEIGGLKTVRSVTASALPVYGENFSIIDAKVLQDSTKKANNTYFFRVDDRFIPTLNIKWLVRHSKPTKDHPVVINETMAKQLNLTAQNYDQPLDIGFGTPMNVVGIVEDFNFTSLASSINPALLSIEDPSAFRENLYVRMAASANTAKAIQDIKHIYSGFEKERPLEYSFLAEDYRALYKRESGMSIILFVFMCFAAIIACMGLFGLSTFSALKRSKEIAIRKVMGASPALIFYLFSKEVIVLVALACLIAVPIAGFIMHNWLSSYATHININAVLIGWSCGLVLLISMVTVAFHAFKSAISNPTGSLKSQ